MEMVRPAYNNASRVCLLVAVVAMMGVVGMSREGFLFQRQHQLQDPGEEIRPLAAKYRTGKVIWEYQ